MFLGHFAVAFAAKPLAPRVSLGTLFLAAQLADLAWPTLVLLGVERFEVRPGITAVTPLDFIHYPYSHSLAALILWGAILGVVYVFVRKGGRGAVGVLAALVVSHWLLDFASHRPDMPIAPGIAERVGLGLWHSLPATLAVEAALFATGIAVYVRCTRALDRAGTWALAGLVAFLSVVYLASLFGPPPPSVAAVAWSAQAIWLLVAWGYWVDRHRQAREFPR